MVIIGTYSKPASHAGNLDLTVCVYLYHHLCNCCNQYYLQMVSLSMIIAVDPVKFTVVTSGVMDMKLTFKTVTPIFVTGLLLQTLVYYVATVSKFISCQCVGSLLICRSPVQ